MLFLPERASLQLLPLLLEETEAALKASSAGEAARVQPVCVETAAGEVSGIVAAPQVSVDAEALAEQAPAANNKVGHPADHASL